MTTARRILLTALLLLVLLYAAWFIGRAEWFAFVIFAAPAIAFASGLLQRRPRAGFWAGVVALAWFSHGVMVAWTRSPERLFALAEATLSVVIVLAASLPGLRARFSRRP